MHLASVDVILIVLYGVFVLAIGFLLRRQMVGSTEFFMAGRSMPAWSPASRSCPRISARRK